MPWKGAIPLMGTIGVAVLAAIYAVMLPALDDRFRWGGGAIVLGCAAWLLVVAVRRIDAGPVCPGCGGVLPPRAAHAPQEPCPKCFMVIRSCEQCGYARIGAATDRCPECGTRVPAQRGDE